MRFLEQQLSDATENTVIKTFHSSVPPAKRGVREHHHTACELSLFLSGKGTYLVQDRIYTFQKGDMFLFGSNEAHCITEVEEQLDLLNIQFEPRILWEQKENMELLQLFMARNKKFSNKFDACDVALADGILGVERELRERQSGFAVQAKSLLFGCLVHILRQYDYIDAAQQVTKHTPSIEKLKEAMIFIDKNLDQKITLGDIADIACMTPNYFSYLFKKYNGLSPWDYITIKRVEMAIEMLRSTDMTKLEIAEKCGFSSSSNFYKAFTKVTGKKPTQYI